MGRTHCEGCGAPLVNPDRLAPGFIGKSHSLVPRRILRTCRENIAYNALSYNFPRLLPLPRVALAQVLSRYKTARLEMDNRGMIARNSPPPVAKRLFACLKQKAELLPA